MGGCQGQTTRPFAPTAAGSGHSAEYQAPPLEQATDEALKDFITRKKTLNGRLLVLR